MNRFSSIFYVLLLLALTACNAKTDSNSNDDKKPSETSTAAPKAQNTPEQDNAKTETDATNAQNNDKQPSYKVEDRCTSASTNLYQNRPDLEIPIPKQNGQIVEFIDGFCDGPRRYNSYNMSNFEFRPDYTKDLLAAGFKEDGNVLIKETHGKTLIVGFVSDPTNESETFTLTMALSRDLLNAYQEIPDKRIPYPLDDEAFAAYYTDAFRPNKDSNEIVYVFRDKPMYFIDEYKRRLENAGFKNVRTDAAPVYTKSVDKNLILSVAIDTFDNENKFHLQMLAKKTND